MRLSSACKHHDLFQSVSSMNENVNYIDVLNSTVPNKWLLLWFFAECHKCHKEGHFASMCKTKVRNQKDNKRKINYVRDNQSDNTDREEYAFVVSNCTEQDNGLIDVRIGSLV